MRSATLWPHMLPFGRAIALLLQRSMAGYEVCASHGMMTVPNPTPAFVHLLVPDLPAAPDVLPWIESMLCSKAPELCSDNLRAST